MILSAQTIEYFCRSEVTKYTGIGIEAVRIPNPDQMIVPFVEKTVVRGRSFGLSHAGYDVRVKSFLHNGEQVDKIRMEPGDFFLASSVERIKMPTNMIAFVKDKSSWAREGLAVQNTVLEPGWEGYITFELSFARKNHAIVIEGGDPIAQLIFQYLDESTENPYKGKYQNQADRPVEAIHEMSPESLPKATPPEELDRLHKDGW